MAGCPSRVCALVDVDQLAAALHKGNEKLLLIDSRPFLEYNTCHIVTATNICSSKIVKRRLQQDKVTVRDLLVHWCDQELDESWTVVVYDQGSWQPPVREGESFLGVLLQKLLVTFRSVSLLAGGFTEFEAHHRGLCEDKRNRGGSQLTSLSQPCLPITNHGPTRILPFLYLGSQKDAQDRNLLRDYNIVYELNVSTSCPKPDFIQDAHFMRIPVDDNYSEKLVPFFTDAFHFLDKVRLQSSGGCALVHCLAGVSRSPTVAIAYVMKHLRMTSDEAYRFVKSKRPAISPNFNFLGQLLDYEKQLRRERILEPNGSQSEPPPAHTPCTKRFYPQESGPPETLPLRLELPSTAPLVSPSRALARLSFERPPVKRASYEVTHSASWAATTQQPHSAWLERAEETAAGTECEVILRKGSGRRRNTSAHDSAYRSLTFDDEYPEDGEGVFKEEPLPSPLSPSEQHLLEDIVDSIDGPKATTHLKKPTSSELSPSELTHRAELESSHDSGITSVSSCSSWSQPQVCTARPRGFSSSEVLSSSSSSSSLVSEDSNVLQQSSALPRARSCPVIIAGWLQGKANWDTPEFAPLQRRGCRSSSSARNRYSCGSLEYAVQREETETVGSVMGGTVLGSTTGERRGLGRPVNLIPVS
ncbi:dual specificity protein phosphatase 16-like [Ornithodoros turicata]